MKNLLYNISAISIVTLVLGLVFGACTEEPNTPPSEFSLFMSSADDVEWAPGDEYVEVYQVTYDGDVPDFEVLATITADGLPAGIDVTIVYYNIGDPTDGSVAPLSDPIVPYQASFTYNVQSGVTPGTSTITLVANPDNEDVSPASESFSLFVSDPGSGPTDCNTDLVGNYAGPGTCAPPGFGDFDSDFTLNADNSKIDIYVELFEPGSNLVADLDCSGNSFTIPQQTALLAGGTQQVNVDGSGTWVISQGNTTVNLVVSAQEVGSSDPPFACEFDLTKQ